MFPDCTIYEIRVSGIVLIVKIAASAATRFDVARNEMLNVESDARAYEAAPLNYFEISK